jgi:putative sigma-54 modulation protein
MDVNIKSIHFDASDKLHEFIDKKLSKLSKASDQIGKAEVTLKVVKPETANNKQAGIRITLPGDELFVEKVCNSFEEAVDLCVESLLRQIDKYKEKQRGR